MIGSRVFPGRVLRVFPGRRVFPDGRRVFVFVESKVPVVPTLLPPRVTLV